MHKIIWMINEYNGPYNSVNTRQTVLSRLLEEQGYKVYLISGSADFKHGPNYYPKDSREKFLRVKKDGAKFIVIPTSDFRHNYERVMVSLQFQRRLWHLRNELPRPDVIINNFAGLFGNVSLKWKKAYGTKVIFDILDLWPEAFVAMGYMPRQSPATKWLYSLEHKAYKNADGIIFSMQGGREYIIDKGWSTETGGDVDTSDIGYLNNGVDLAYVDAQRDKYVLDDADLLIDKTKKFTAIYLGSISAFNGVDILVKAAHILQKRGNDRIQILVYGYGNREEQLKEMAFRYKLSNIRFKGALDKRYAMNVLSRGDLNLFTFENTPILKYGTSPNKLFMYYSSGKPVLSMIRPKYDLVEDNKCGLSVDNDPELIADALERFSWMEQKEYNEYAYNARKTAEEYDYQNLVKVLLHHIEKGNKNAP